MKVDEIEHIYRNSNNIFDDLYNYFYKNAAFLNVLRAPITKDTILFRARDVDSIDNIKTIEDVQYPPSSPDYSRIGKPDQIWLYTSDHYQACLSEMLPFWYDKYNLGETITVIITTWRIKVNLNIIFIPDSNNTNEILKHYGLNSYFKNDPLWDYICNKFKTQKFEDKNIYQFTSAFSNFLIDAAESEDEHIDGIFYPCVQYPIKSNIALRSNLVDNSSVILNEIKKIETLKRAELNDNSLPSYDINADTSKELDGEYGPKQNKITWKLK